MRDVVRAAWIDFTERFEGGVAYPYADIRNLITIAYGNLIDPVSAALGLPFIDAATGQPATPAQITAGWLAVKNDPTAARRGHTYARGLTTLRLTPEGMRALALDRLESNDRILHSRLPDRWDDLGACAQMALHSLAWACGAGADFPRLFRAVADGDFEEAAVQIHMNEWTPEGTHNAGLVPRNVANKILLRNAAYVRDLHLDPDTLEWRRLLAVSEAETQPALENPASYPTIHVGAEMYRLDEDPDPEAA